MNRLLQYLFQFLSQLWRRLLSLLRRGRYEREMEEEMRFHLEMQIEQNLAAGIPAEEAQYAAQRQFGNQTWLKEVSREMWSLRLIEALIQDLRYGARMLMKNPGFSVIAIVTLALGIGATTTMFSIVNSVALRPLPFHEPDRLVMLEEKWLPRFPRFETSPLDFLSWKAECQSYADTAAFATVFFNINEGDQPERIAGARMNANLPGLLGVSPILGRGFTTEEDTAGANQVALLGHRLWQRRFGGDPNMIGRSVRMNGAAFTVVGVMPPAFRFPLEAEIWVPMGFTPEELKSRNNHFIWAVGRLKPGVTPQQAQSEMDILMPRIQGVWRGRVVSFSDHYIGDAQLTLGVLLGAAGLVLLISCVNIANLLIARGAARQREMALRASLGATRGRIVRQLLTETTLLSFLGGAAGLLLALGAIALVRRWPLPTIHRIEEASLDPQALALALLLAIGTGVLFGLSPALRQSRLDLQDALKAGSRVAGGAARTRIRNALVIAELALAVVLLVGAGLLLKSLWRLLDVPLGFNPQNVLAVTINLPRTTYREPFQQSQFAERLLDRLKSVPGTEAVGISTGVPLLAIGDVGIYFEGRSGELSGTTANYYQVSPGYLRVMQIRLVRGRLLTEQDSATSPPVVLINETMASRFFPNEDPIGKRLDISGPAYMREIVGVVGDVKQESLRTPTPPQVYEPFSQKPGRSFHVLLRVSANPAQFAETVRQEVRAIDNAQPISEARPMEAIVAQSLTRDRFSALILGAFGCLAVILAAVGIYGVIAYSVAQRTNEIGVRMALGAQGADVVWLVLRQGLRLVIIGIAIGLLISAVATRVLAAVLFGISPADPGAFGAVALLLGLVALLACWIPARRATKVDPLVALRID
jgi:putative ABC transport system permease protein